jgi:hypothetical protein
VRQPSLNTEIFTNMKKTILMGALAVLWLNVSSASVYNSGTLSVGQEIADGNVVPYPTSFTKTDIPIPDGESTPALRGVEVSLNISGGFNGDLYGYLTFQSVDSSVTTITLLNMVGTTVTPYDPLGYRDAGIIVTLSDSGATSIHNYGGNGGAQFNAGSTKYSADAGSFADFNGKNANGTWTFNLADLSGGDTSYSTLVSWSLMLDVVPEPTTWAAIIFGTLFAGVQTVRFVRGQKLKSETLKI